MISNTIGMELALIPAGRFLMGSPENEEGRESDERQHEVTVSASFYMGRTEVTQGQWKKVMGTEPWKGNGYAQNGDTYPAVCVSWHDAIAFCEILGATECRVYRLPTEAEWEYACRGHSSAAYSFGSGAYDLGKHAWFVENTQNVGQQHASRVAQKLANSFGLYDMHGNVSEWCADFMALYPSNEAIGPPSPSVAYFTRVLRGGNWLSDAADCRSASRVGYPPKSSFAPDVGFRVVLE